MSATLITAHVWRPPHGSKVGWLMPWAERPCEFMNCRLPRGEHARAVPCSRLVKR